MWLDNYTDFEQIRIDVGDTRVTLFHYTCSKNKLTPHAIMFKEWRRVMPVYTK